MNQIDIGKKIRFFRMRAGFSQHQLELETNSSFGSISRTESGQVNPNKETIHKIADILGLSDLERAELLGIKIDTHILNNFDTILSFDKKIIGEANIDVEKIKEGLGVGLSEYDIKVDTGAQTIVEACQKTIEGFGGEIYFISNMNEWRRVFTEEYSKQNYIPQRIKKQIYLKTLTLRDREAEKAKSEDPKLFREYRYLSNDFKFIHTIAFTNNKFYIYECRPPYRTVTIDSEKVAGMFKTFFDSMWRLSSGN